MASVRDPQRREAEEKAGSRPCPRRQSPSQGTGVPIHWVKYQRSLAGPRSAWSSVPSNRGEGETGSPGRRVGIPRRTVQSVPTDHVVPMTELLTFGRGVASAGAGGPRFSLEDGQSSESQPLAPGSEIKKLQQAPCEPGKREPAQPPVVTERSRHNKHPRVKTRRAGPPPGRAHRAPRTARSTKGRRAQQHNPERGRRTPSLPEQWGPVSAFRPRGQGHRQAPGHDLHPKRLKWRVSH